MARGMPLSGALVVGALAASTASTPAHANARITGLADVSYGTINTFTDQSNSQNLCVFSVRGNTNSRTGYSVLATGDGGTGGFTLASGAGTLPYQVRWADGPNQLTGTLLTPGVNVAGFGNSSNNQTCANGANDNASLTVTITGTELASAMAGNYSGVLSITIIPN